MAALLVLIGLTTSSCQPAGVATSPTEHLQTQFPLLQRLGVATIWDDQDCTYFAYMRGVFSVDPGNIGCFVDGQEPAVLFDEHAQKDFDTIRTAFVTGSDPLDFAAVWYGSDAAIRGGSYFDLNRCTSYVYWPGYTGPGDIDEDAKFTPIDEDWYSISYCG